MLADAACALYAEGQLFRETALALYGEVLTGSVTRVEEYFRCPFRHFANYGLRLRQLPEFQIAQQDLGSLAHRAIELVFRAAAKAEKSPAAYSDDELRAAAADAGIGVHICGEMAGDTRCVEALLQAGLRELSMSANRIPHIKEFLSGLRIGNR